MQYDTVDVQNKGPSEEEIDVFKKNRRTASKSLDVSSKAFVPTNRNQS